MWWITIPPRLDPPEAAAKVGTSATSEDTTKLLPLIATTTDLEKFTSIAPDFECVPFDDNSWDFEYPAHGLSIFITLYSTIMKLTLYGPGDKRFAIYPGDLPEGLAWTDSQAEVEAKLKGGRKTQEDRSTITYWRSASKRRYTIFYRRGHMSRLTVTGLPS